MAERETEFKFLLSSFERDRLRVSLGEPVRVKTFVNRYYTLNSSGRKDWVLRIREDSSNRVLTLKIGREVAPGVFDSVEYSASVGPEEASWESTEPMRVFREQISQDPISLQGEMGNRREVYRAPIDVGALWELDAAKLPNGEQFSELEVEVVAELEGLAELRRRLESWLGSVGINPVPSAKTKYARFLASLEA